MLIKQSQFILIMITSSLITASPVFAKDNYGAIAYCQETEAFGYSSNFDNRKDAESTAIENCDSINEENEQKGKCTVQVWFKNGCGALAKGEDGFGTGWGKYKQLAQEKALEVCNQHTSECDIVETVCTD